MLYVLIFCVSFVANVFNTMSGGGASVITIPVWLVMGLNLPTAVFVQKTTDVFSKVVAFGNYMDGVKKIGWKFLAWCSVLGLVGVYFGVLTVATVKENIMKTVVGLCILGVVAYFVANKNVGVEQHWIKNRKLRKASCLLAPLAGFYQGMFGAGNGIFVTIMGIKMRGYDYLTALGYYMGMSVIWDLVAAVMFYDLGFFNINFAIVASLGGATGSYVGSKIAMKRGSAFAKYVFIVIGFALGLKLILGF